MNRMIRSLLLILLVGVSGSALAQSGGIDGTVKDQKGETIPGASVVVSQGGIQKAVTGTDNDGHYEAKPLSPGVYQVTFTTVGLKDIVTDVRVSADITTRLNYQFTSQKELTGVTVTTSRYKVPLISTTGVSTVKTSEQIERLVNQQTSDIVALGTQVYQGKQGGGLSIGGGRGTGNLIVIDGVQYPAGSLGTSNLPVGSIDQVQTYSSGVPARYGDASGGVVSITTKGITSTLNGTVRLERSVEGFGHNQGSFFISGPLAKRYADSSHTDKVPVLGFTLGGEVLYDKDQDPAYGGVYVLNDEARSRIEAHPLIATPTTTGGTTLGYAAENVTNADLKKVKRRPNAQYLSGKLNPKIDYQLSPNVSVTLGGTLFANKSSNYSRTQGLFSSDLFGETRNFSGVGFLRFTQKFGRPGVTLDKEFNTISNAYYTVQADYKKDLQNSGNKNHKQNTFNYGYVGKFHEKYAPVYFGGIEDSSGKTGIRLLGYTPTGVTFERSELNPLLANYTSDFYNYYGENNIFTQGQIAANRGLRNGDAAQSVYSLWSNVGAGTTGWSKRNEDQVSVTVDASFDFQAKKESKTRHSIQFGLYYQQRNERYYSINGAYLWTLMRQLTSNVVGNQVDYTNPHFVINGVRYSLEDVRNGVVNPSPTDTIQYDRIFSANRQGAFDKALRAKLGVDNHTYINVDELDPSFFSVDMFSADELLNSGSSAVGYSGYDYKGNLTKGQVNFNDFWTAKDGPNYTRPIGAYRPNYIAGYIQDYIQFKKDVRFTLGVRVERFDNNTKVLKDPYSLYATKTTGDVKGENNLLNGRVHPANIGSNYVVYVASNATSSPTVVGYRNGDDWYDAFGRQIEDPQSLKKYTGGVDPQPYLQNPNVKIQDTTFDPTNSFTDYKPQVNVMPRVNFSFPINDVALFYAHYDVLVQRPTVGSFATPLDYYFITQNAQNTIGNPDLKPEKAINYEVGFQQQLTKNSAVTLAAFYKERKDQIQIRPYLYANPITYYTYGNRDFSSTKGFSVAYDLRRIGNVSMGINYTLQFAEGTGSSATSAGSGLLQNFIGASLPNLRSPFALDYDSRHNINANIDYRFITREENGVKSDRGPMLFGIYPFENAGINLTFFTRSGEPYTRYLYNQTLLGGQFVSHVIQGTVNGSRLPWHYMLNLRVDKDFTVNFKKGSTDMRDIRRRGGIFMTAYVSVQNLLNTRDVLSVYGYTGKAGDDGYLTSPDGQIRLSQTTNSQAFNDLYNLRQNEPGQLNNPRRINIGLQMNF